LFPSDINFGDLLTALENGARQGIQDFVDDLGSLSGTDSGSSAALGSLDSLPSLSDIVNAISSAASSAYGALRVFSGWAASRWATSTSSSKGPSRRSAPTSPA
jgi:hypothetical protein